MFYRVSTATLNLDTFPDQRTYCIIGQGRGGTTMIADLVDMLGVPLLKNGNKALYNFRTAIFSENNQEIIKNIELNNQKSVWAWKLAQCGKTLPNWYNFIRNPFWIYIIRDNLASALTEVRIGVSDNVLSALKIKSDQEQLMNDFIFKANAEYMPILLVSYERVRLHKGEFINSLIKFLGVNPSVETITQATDYIQEEGPLQRSRLF